MSECGMYVLKVTCGVIRLGDVALVLVPALGRLHDLVRVEEVRVHLTVRVCVRKDQPVCVCVRTGHDDVNRCKLRGASTWNGASVC